ncbi:MAG: Cache 3/Cache 2 fusion domain-containing protein [Motilibacteraceae bacterium]
MSAATWLQGTDTRGGSTGSDLQGADRARAEAVAQAEELSSATRAVAEATGAVATGVDQMQAALERAARDTGRAAEVTEQAVTEAEATGRQVRALREASERIDEVVQLIASITQQSRMLALNATIEAARAGQAGRGFSVVAQEMKQLAGRTAQAADRVAEQIATLQQEAANAASALDGIARTMGGISQAQAEVVETIEEQRAQAVDVAVRCHEASEGAAAISSSVARLVEAQRVEYVTRALATAMDYVEARGGAQPGGPVRDWVVKDQETTSIRSLRVEQLLVAGEDLGQNDNPALRSGVVDDVVDLIGGTCTIFQCLDDGSLMRLGTNIVNELGRRNVGSFIPAVRADGTLHPIVTEVLEGRTYIGRATVVGREYSTAYAPLRDRTGEVVGCLYVGLPVEA